MGIRFKAINVSRDKLIAGGLLCFGVLCLAVLSMLNGYSDFWQGYFVELAGVITELAIVYFFVNYLISKNEQKKAEPVYSKLFEYVEMLHVHLFKSLEYLLTAADKKQSTPTHFPKLGFIYRHDELTKFQVFIEKFLVHASLHLGKESYGKVVDYLDSTTELIRLVEDLQDIVGQHPPPEGWQGNSIESNYTKSIGVRHFKTAEDLYFSLRDKHTYSNDSFMNPYMMLQRERTPKAEVLLELASKVRWIKLKENQ